MLDHHLWIEVTEYLATALCAVLIAWFLADSLGSPLWGGLAGIRLH